MSSFSSSSGEDFTLFETIDPRSLQHRKTHSLQGVVDGVLAHDGAFYAHTIGKGVSGIYKLKTSGWMCIVGTSDNTQHSKHARADLDSTAPTQVRKLFAHTNGSLCFSTARKIFRIADDAVEDMPMELVRDYYAHDGVVAKISKDGAMHLGDAVARSSNQDLRFRDDARVRSSKDCLLFITASNSLVSLNVHSGTHTVIAPRVTSFDVAAEHFTAYSTGRQVHLQYSTAQQSETVSCGGKVLDVAACSGGILVALST